MSGSLQHLQDLHRQTLIFFMEQTFEATLQRILIQGLERGVERHDQAILKK